MPFSHHTHSGQFCAHASDSLRDVVSHAIRQRRMLAFHLTEHCPRHAEHLYPEEVRAGVDAARLEELYDGFVAEAVRLRRELQEDAATIEPCHMLIGFEAEWIEPASSAAMVRRLLQKHAAVVDYFIGSVHHVHAIPIDFDRAMYDQALAAAGGSERALFHAYFDAQHDMIQALRPKLLGHFDLVRLFSARPEQSLIEAWHGSLWPKILRNLDLAKSIGAVLEINTAALRKGLQQPYPRLEICRAWKERGGAFVLSDDSHSVSQVGTHYPQVLSFLEQLQLQELAFFTTGTPGNPCVQFMPMAEVRRAAFWSTGPAA